MKLIAVLVLCVLVLGYVCADSTDVVVDPNATPSPVDPTIEGSATITTTTTTTTTPQPSTEEATPTDAPTSDTNTNDASGATAAAAPSTDAPTGTDAPTHAPTDASIDSNNDNTPTTPAPTTAPTTPPPSCTETPPQCPTYTTCGQCTYQHCGWCDATQSCLPFNTGLDACPSNTTWITPGQTCPNTIVHLTYDTSVDTRLCGTAFGDYYREPTPFFTLAVPRDIGKIVAFHLVISSTSVEDPILEEPWDSIHVQMQAQRKNCPWHDIAYSWDLLDQSITNDDNSKTTSWNVEWIWDPIQGRHSWTDDGKLQLAFQSSKGFVLAADCMHDVKLELTYEYIPQVVEPCQWDNQCVRTNSVELDMDFDFNGAHHMTMNVMTWMMACVAAIVITWL